MNKSKRKKRSKEKAKKARTEKAKKVPQESKAVYQTMQKKRVNRRDLLGMMNRYQSAVKSVKAKDKE